MAFYVFYPPTNIVTVPGHVVVDQGTTPWIIAGTVAVSNFPPFDTDYGTVGASTLRTAAQIGNATGAALFGAGTTGAQVLRVVLPTDQTAIPVTQSGTWDIGTVSTITNPVTVNQGTSPWVITGSTTVSGTVTANQGTSPWVVSGTVAATQSGAWTTGRTWTLASGTDSVAAVQSGTWNIGTVTTITNSVAVTQSTSPWSVAGNVASGAADSGNPVKIGGVYNSTTPTFTNGQRADSQADTTGALLTNTESQKATYSAAAQFTIAANPTDVFTITGSATKTIRIQKLSLNGTNTANTNAFCSLIRRSTANTAGTSSTLTNVPSDTTQVAGTAVVRSYTVNPTLGTAVGTFRNDEIFLPTLGSTNSNLPVKFVFGEPHCKSIVLRGTSEVMALNFGGALIGGTTVLAVDITWTEE